MIYKVASLSLFEHLQKWTFKKDMPGHLRPFAIRIDFGLWGLVYVAKLESGLLAKDGSQIPVHTAHLINVGLVIGLRDLEAAKNRPYAEAWRESMHGRIQERLGI